jgi:uncharacterized Zn finger protein
MAGQQDVERVCPLCGGARSRPFLSKGTLQLVRCGSCSMVYSNPIETDLANGLFYDRMGTSISHRFALNGSSVSFGAIVQRDRFLMWDVPRERFYIN